MRCPVLAQEIYTEWDLNTFLIIIWFLFCLFLVFLNVFLYFSLTFDLVFSYSLASPSSVFTISSFLLSYFSCFLSVVFLVLFLLDCLPPPSFPSFVTSSSLRFCFPRVGPQIIQRMKLKHFLGCYFSFQLFRLHS